MMKRSFKPLSKQLTRRLRPVAWFDVGEWMVYDTSASDTMAVFETEEPDGHQSSLVLPNGDPIIYEHLSQKQGFIGFLPPRDYYEDEYAATE